MSKELLIALITGILTIGGSVIAVILNRKSELRKQIEVDLRNKKVPMYEDFLKISVGYLLDNKKKQNPNSENHLLNDLRRITPVLLVWASEDVIKAWSNFKQASGDPDQQPNIIFMFEALIQSIRKDLGHIDDNIQKGEILTLFINDIHTSLKKESHS
jgi:hypothetical protein